MTTCRARTVDLPRPDRVHISWPVTGVGPGDVAEASLDGGHVWVPLAVATDMASVIGYFAGPGFAVPGAATVVPYTSYVMIRITTATERLTFPGGFIRITG